MSINTVREHICALTDKGLISPEDTVVFTKNYLKHNGNLLHTIRPINKLLNAHRQSQLWELELATARWERSKTALL